MKTFYLDIDDTYLDTEAYVRKVCHANGLRTPKDDSVFLLRSTKRYGDIIDMIFLDYSVIPKKQGALECLKLIRTEYDVVFCSAAYSELEAEAKRKFAKVEGIPLLLTYNQYDKSGIDMTNSIFCDDKRRNLLSSNAERSILMYSPYAFESEFEMEAYRGEVVLNWFQLLDKVIGGEKDAELREYFRKRIQSYCQGYRVQGYL